jgi:L-fucose isomerase-like protein
VSSDAEASTTAAADCDAFLVFGASGAQQWLERLAASKKPNVLFVRHRSGPVYLWYEIAHWRLLRKSEDTLREPNLDVDDVVVDEYADVLWRLRGLYGLKNAKGTTVLAIGGLAAYSTPGQQLGPAHAKEVWGYDLKTATHEEVAERLRQARADQQVMRAVAQQADELLAQPNVTLKTDRKFVVNSFLALRVFKDLMREVGATNLGVAQCMGSLIALLDTPPCLVLSLLNDEGLTAFCHTDLTHTLPGVLLRWISGKPSFICNSHFPHHGVLTLAHCSAPRKMNGRNPEPTTLMTHYESDYGAATKVEYPKGQVVTCIVPNLRCTKWFAFRGKIVASPALDMCRSQMDVEIQGDWRRLLRELEGFHTVVCYGDYLREVGYALKKVGQLEWANVSEPASGQAT